MINVCTKMKELNRWMRREKDVQGIRKRKVWRDGMSRGIMLPECYGTLPMRMGRSKSLLPDQGSVAPREDPIAH